MNNSQKINIDGLVQENLYAFKFVFNIQIFNNIREIDSVS